MAPIALYRHSPHEKLGNSTFFVLASANTLFTPIWMEGYGTYCPFDLSHPKILGNHFSASWKMNLSLNQQEFKLNGVLANFFFSFKLDLNGSSH